MNCQHTACRCQVEEGRAFCSDYCQEHAGEGHEGHRCECGHPACSDAGTA
jgi:hypothetical protein